jgi:glutamyl-tRNA reductase
LKELKVIAFTHKQLELKNVGSFVFDQDIVSQKLTLLKSELAISEIFYLATCNRVEFVFTNDVALDLPFLKRFVSSLRPDLDAAQAEEFACKAEAFSDVEAFNHLLRVSCSLESMVVGEKEILAQLRQAYENCRTLGFTGDFLRLVMDRVIKTAKEVYTHTNISKNPISVVSIAYRKLKSLGIEANARFLVIGAGETNQLISKYLSKHKLTNFTVFNRTLEKAESLAKELNGKAYSLTELKNYKQGFDVIITCTAATEPIITPEIYQSLLNGENGKKIIVDLAIPNDTHPEVLQSDVHFIDIESLQEIAKKNMEERCGELCNAEKIIIQNMDEFKPVLKQRRVELAMREVPEKIKEIRQAALSSVFVDDLNSLDENSKEVIDKILNYMEKKYISIPMVMAKEILIKE